MVTSASALQIVSFISFVDVVLGSVVGAVPLVDAGVFVVITDDRSKVSLRFSMARSVKYLANKAGKLGTSLYDGK